MKKLFRMLVFPFLAIMFTSLWNKGFILPGNVNELIKLILLMAFIYYLLVPLSKIVLFPINLLAFGLGSFLVYLLSFYLLDTYFSLLSIESWQFPGFSFYFLSIPKANVSYLMNLILSSLSVSSIINILETIL